MKIIESISILTRFAVQIGNRATLIIDFQNGKFGSNVDAKTETLITSIISMIVVDTVSFLDEYNSFFGVRTETEYSERAKIVKAINKPMISQINKWKDLEKLRNHFIAHNLRQGKNGDFVLRNNDLNYNAPRTIYDYLLLSNLIQFSTETVNSEFEFELENQDKNTEQVVPNYKQMTKDDVSKITIDLLKKSEEIKKKKGRTYPFSAKKIVWDELKIKNS